MLCEVHNATRVFAGTSDAALSDAPGHVKRFANALWNAGELAKSSRRTSPLFAPAAAKASPTESNKRNADTRTCEFQSGSLRATTQPIDFGLKKDGGLPSGTKTFIIERISSHETCVIKGVEAEFIIPA